MSAAKAEKILVVGTGTMGEGIAQTFAQNGFDVRLVARREEPLTRAMSQIKQNVKQFIEFDLIQETVDAGHGPHRGHGDHRHGPGRRGVQLRGGDHPREPGRQAGSPRRHPGRRTPNLVIGSNTGSMTVDSLAEGMPSPGKHHRHPLLQPGAHHPAGRDPSRQPRPPTPPSS